MSSKGFTFPPPPPPPPSQQQQPTFPSVSPQYGQNYGQRGGRGAGGHNRSRGRGHGNRGGGRGGSFVPPHVSQNPAYSTTTQSVGYGSLNYAGYTGLPHNIQTPQMTPLQSPGFYHPNTTPFPSPQQFPQPSAALGSQYQRPTSYDATYAPPNAQSAPTYYSIPQQTPMMGLPMHQGFETSSSTGSFSGPQHGNPRAPRQVNTYGKQSSYGEHSTKYGKRDHASAFGGKPRSVVPRVPAPPAVPGFGSPLPVKPPPAAGAAQKPKKKKRKHNQLGLTPKTEEHESSEEEDDVDEESRLAPAVAGAAAPLQITYGGRTSTLQSAADIAAWIEERKKRFPTQARIEEKKKVMEAAEKAREEALKQKEAARQKQKRPPNDTRKPNDQSDNLMGPVDEVAKAKRKAEKLRRKLIKEQARAAKAEADAERARLKVEELQKSTMKAGTGPEPATAEVKSREVEKKMDTRPSNFQDGQSETLAISGEPEEKKPGDLVEAQDQDSVLSLSDISDSSDWTSSSGSDLLTSDSDESDEDSAPEEISSRREGPERVPPPPRGNNEKKKQVCIRFARSGRCFWGAKCHYLHETPERGPKSRPIEKKGRKGLFQALVERQKADEDRRTMEVIMWLGENGFLEAPNAKEVMDLNGVESREPMT